MGQRLESNFYSLDGDFYEVKIYDSSYASTVIPFNLGAQGFQLRYNSNTEDIADPIVGSSLEFTMRVENSDHESFISDLIGAPENRFVVQVDRDSSRWWLGLLLVDQVEIEDNDADDGHAYDFSIRAVDGLGRLKDIDYNNAGTAYSGWATLREHIFNCLAKIGLDSFYSSGYYFQGMVNWYEDDMTYSTATDPLDKTRLNHKTFIFINRKGDITYKNCYEVLEQIAMAFRARLFYADGSYWLAQLNEMDNVTSTVHAYTQAGAYTSRTGVTTRRACYNSSTAPSSDFFIRSGGRFSYLAPVKRSLVTYKHYDTQNYAAGQDLFTGFTLTDVYSNGNTAVLVVSFTISCRVVWSDPAAFNPVYAVYRLTVAHNGNSYLSRPVTWYDNGYEYGETKWTNEGADTYEIVLGPFDYTGQKITENQQVYMPELQEDGDMTFSIIQYEVREAAQNDIKGAGFTLTDDIDYLYVEVIQEGTVEDQYNEEVYEATNTDTDNSLKITREVLLGDGPNPNSVPRLQIYTGADWEDSGDASGGWRVGNSGTFYDLGQLLANETLAGQEIPIARFDGVKFGGGFDAYKNAYRASDSTPYIFHSGTFRAKLDEWDGTWMAIKHPAARVAVQGAIRQIGDPLRNGRELSPTTVLHPVIINTTRTIPINTAETVLEALAVTKTAARLTSGDTITSFNIDAIGVDGVIQSGDQILIIDPATGASERATVTADVGPADTTVSISSLTLTYDLSDGAYIYKEPVQAAAAGAPIVEYFDAHSSATITAGNSILRIDRLLENGIELSEGAGRDYTFTGDTITLAYTPTSSNFKLVYYAA